MNRRMSGIRLLAALGSLVIVIVLLRRLTKLDWVTLTAIALAIIRIALAVVQIAQSCSKPQVVYHDIYVEKIVYRPSE